MKSQYDVVIIGAGHNGLIAGAYLSRTGLSVLILEKRPFIGGATLSAAVFPGMDVRPSVYSYLISLLPQKIITDLALDFKVTKRKVGSYTPYLKDREVKALLVSNENEETTRRSFFDLTESDEEYKKFKRFLYLESLLADKIWPILLKPLVLREDLKEQFKTDDEKLAWETFIEKPLSYAFDSFLTNDVVKGMVFTDAKIGMLTSPDDASLLQNKTFLYHIIGQGTGEWNVPVGGMGELINSLYDCCISAGAMVKTNTVVEEIEGGSEGSIVYYEEGAEKRKVKGRFILANIAPTELEKILDGYSAPETVTGSVFKVNMLVKKLPRLRSCHIPEQAFAGTFHIDEGYEAMKKSFNEASRGDIPLVLPGEIYCHTLTDPSIISEDLYDKGYHTLTYFGLDAPYELFKDNNEQQKEAVISRFLKGINNYLLDPLEDCLAVDQNGQPCLEAKTPVDLEEELRMPRGNIFHGNLDWPFTESLEEVGKRGVETLFSNIFICGSGARRGGAVSGIPGYQAAQAVLEALKLL